MLAYIIILEMTSEMNMHVFIVYPVAITVYFEKTALSIHENSSSVKSVLILSRPSSTDITIQVDDIPGCATSKLSKP